MFLIDDAIDKNVKSYKIDVFYKFDPLQELNKNNISLINVLKGNLKHLKGIKIYRKNLLKENLKEESFFKGMINPESFVVKRITQTFWSKAYVIISEDDILRVLDLTTNELMKRIHDFLAQGPGL